MSNEYYYSDENPQYVLGESKTGGTIFNQRITCVR